MEAVRLFALLAATAGLLSICSSASASVGSASVGTAVDGNTAGRTQDYRVSASATEDVDRLSVYLDGSSTAKSVEIGLYQSASSTRAGARLARCVVAAPVANAWNRCSITAVSVTKDTTYWLAILHPSGSAGTIRYRNRTGTGRTFGSSSSTLKQTPSRWSNGPDWGSHTASVYADRSGTTTPPPAPAPTPPPPSPGPAPDYTPQHVSARADGSSIVLDWDDSADPDFAHFAVRRSTDRGADEATWSRLAPNYTASTARDSGLAAGTYHYYVTEVGRSGAVSGRSAVVSATVNASPAPAPQPTPEPTPEPTPPPPSPQPGACSATQHTPGGSDGGGGCWPGAATTGVPDGAVLTSYTGSCTVTTPNAVIQAKTVNCGYLNIAASNVRIVSSKINGSVWIDDPDRGYSFTITDSEIDAGPVDASHNDGKSSIGKSNFVATRVETRGGIRGIWCEYDCTVQDSWIHGQDRDEGGAAHESGIRMGDGSVLRHNSIACDAPNVAPDAGCSADLTGYGDFAPIRNNRIEHNLFVATPGGTCAYGGSSGAGSKPYAGQAANIVFRDNVFQRRSSVQSSGKCGYWFPISDFDSSRPGNQWINNKWDDGGPVSPN
jgi:hypothetical protein